MFRNWSNTSSNAYTEPSDDEVVSKSSQSCSPFARSDEIQDERISNIDFSPCVNNATHLDPKKEFNDGERRNGMSKRERLELINRGNHNGKWRINQTLRNDSDDWNFCRALTSQMGLSERERVITWRIFKQMDMRTYRSIEPGESEATMKQFLVAFCVGALVYNKLHREYEWTHDNWKYYPGRTPSKKSKRYQGPKARLDAEQRGDEGDRHQTIEQCAEQLGFTETEIRSCIEKVRAELPTWVAFLRPRWVRIQDVVSELSHTTLVPESSKTSRKISTSPA